MGGLRASNLMFGPLWDSCSTSLDHLVLEDFGSDITQRWLISGSSWSLPHPRSQEEVDLHAYLTTITLPLDQNVSDEHEWVVGDSSLHVFRLSATWEVLRPRQDTKDWTDVVWFKGAVLKHSFTMWIANYDRLPTKSRLADWGLPISANCSLSSTFDETREHLLLSCKLVSKFGGSFLKDAIHRLPVS